VGNPPSLLAACFVDFHTLRHAAAEPGAHQLCPIIAIIKTKQPDANRGTAAELSGPADQRGAPGVGALKPNQWCYACKQLLELIEQFLGVFDRQFVAVGFQGEGLAQEPLYLGSRDPMRWRAASRIFRSLSAKLSRP
jgi:hypothetical protein